MPKRKVSARIYDSEDRAIEVVGIVYPGSRDYFDRSFGNWLPGDPAEVEILEARPLEDGADVEGALADPTKAEDALLEAFSEEPDDDDIFDWKEDR